MADAHTEAAQAMDAAATLMARLHNARKSNYIGEVISQLEHALQSAAAAQRAHGDDEEVLAALFHDIGHLLDPEAALMQSLGVIKHEELGAEFLLVHGVSDRLAKLVRSHVQAKRYLCWKSPNYYQRLSNASMATLAWQGGAMESGEAREFERDPDMKAILALRSWDEMAKDPLAKVPPLETYRPMLTAHLQRKR